MTRPANAEFTSHIGAGPYVGCGLILTWWFYDLQVHWSSLPEYQFGWIVLILVAYLLWEGWGARPRQDTPVAPWKAAILLLIGFPLVLTAELYKQAIGPTAISSMSLSIGSALFITAMLLVGAGPKTWWHFSFPLFFCFVAVPIPKVIWNPIVLGLQSLISLLNVEALSLLGIPAIRHANVIQLPNCLVGIDEACSGVRSLQSSVMAGAFLGHLLLRTRALRVALIIVAVASAIIGNLGRSLYLALVASGRASKPHNAHDSAGWSVLALTALLLAGCAMVAIRLEAHLPRCASNKA